MAFVTHNNYRSGVNSMPIANARPSGFHISRIQNRVYRQCAKDGFNARIKAELAGVVPATVPLYSHSLTRQSYFEQGWHAVTHLHILKAREQRKAQAMAVPNEQ
ncbi:conserved hypothetical protein [Shewanella baltica OS195]|uniref:Uncharacterized protein n=1 Tax=Shewanella baltica (strain OS195) TaxID=399599 RepID=A9L0L7_SHEB9|nr:hypothetical protein [Shewanella baltica]ABX49297.1 conserved hypothetical protein [Shewanella baltica OS195]ADT94287.1 hypothetical protein Sbal678_2130 [Shewanella baltica OS678]